MKRFCAVAALLFAGAASTQQLPTRPIIKAANIKVE